MPIKITCDGCKKEAQKRFSIDGDDRGSPFIKTFLNDKQWAVISVQEGAFARKDDYVVCPDCYKRYRKATRKAEADFFKEGEG